MKKNLMKVSVLAVAMLTLVGCGGKKANTTVSCSYSQEESMLTVNQDLDLVITDGVFESAKLINEIVYADEYVGKYDESVLISSLEEQFDDYNDVDVTATSTGAIVTITLDIDEFADMSDISKDDLSNIMEDDISDIEASLEEENYICK